MARGAGGPVPGHAEADGPAPMGRTVLGDEPQTPALRLFHTSKPTAAKSTSPLMTCW